MNKMSYTGIVLVSHSSKVAEGIKEIIREVTKEVPVVAAGGTEENEIGTSVEKIEQAIHQADGGNGVLVFYDIGSAKMNVEMLLETVEDVDARLLEAPILEGSYVAAVEASMEKSVDDISQAIKKSFG